MSDISINNKNARRFLCCVMNNLLPMIAFFIVVSCATGSTIDENRRLEGNLEGECSSVDYLSENDIRRMLLEAKMHWDSIRAHVASKKNKGAISEGEDIDFTVQDSEFAKYYDNALMLYLSGDVSSDFYRSVITLKQLFIIAQGCYPEVKKETNSIDKLDNDCITAHPLEEDEKRTSLYKIKSEWDELSIMISGHQIRGKLSDDELRKYNALKSRFNENYRSACMLYLGGDVTSDELIRSFMRLEEINQDGNKLLDDVGR